jgi:hypothetical protein
MEQHHSPPLLRAIRRHISGYVRQLSGLAVFYGATASVACKIMSALGVVERVDQFMIYRANLRNVLRIVDLSMGRGSDAVQSNDLQLWT